MAAPEILSVALNKSTYAAGETMILTVRARDLDEQAFELTISVRTPAGDRSEPVTVTATVDELTMAVTDSSGRVWTQTSRVGDTWTWTAVA